jgi:hypothetical protein
MNHEVMQDTQKKKKKKNRKENTPLSLAIFLQNENRLQLRKNLMLSKYTKTKSAEKEFNPLKRRIGQIRARTYRTMLCANDKSLSSIQPIS